jgi:hypothetical protein
VAKKKEESGRAAGVKQVSKSETRRQITQNAVRDILESMLSDDTDVYIGDRRLYRQRCGNNAAVQKLRPLFRIPGISPDGSLSVDEGFKAQVLALAKDMVTQFFGLILHPNLTLAIPPNFRDNNGLSYPCRKH